MARGLRIVGGALGGRRFGARVSDAARPTSDRVREAMFSALFARGLLDAEHALDLFSGTGALAFEALSRGVKRVTCVDNDAHALKHITADARSLGVLGRMRIINLDLMAPRVSWKRFDLSDVDLVFADPPYAQTLALRDIIESLEACAALSNAVHFVVESASKSPVELPEWCDIERSYRYGKTEVTLAARQTL